MSDIMDRAARAERADPYLVPGVTMPTPAAPASTKAADVATIAADRKAQAQKDFWTNLGGGSYEALNQVLLGLPDFVVKRVIGSDAYNALNQWRAEHPAAYKVGGVAGILGGAFTGSTEIKALKALEELGSGLRAGTTAAKAAGLAGRAARGLEEATPLVRTLSRTVPATAIDYGTYGDLPGALTRGAVATGLGVGAEAALGRGATNALKAKAAELAEYPENYTLGKAGIGTSDIEQGIAEAKRVGRAEAKAAGAPVEGTARVTVAEKKGAIDPVKKAIAATIRGEGVRNPSAFSKLLAEAPIEDIRAAVARSNPGLDADTLEQVVQAISSFGVKSMAGDIPASMQAGTNLAAKLAAIAKPTVIGAGLGAGAAGASSIQDILGGGAIDPQKIAAGALGGAALAVLPRAVPAALRGATAAAGPLLKGVAAMPGTVGQVAERAITGAQPLIAKGAETAGTTATPVQAAGQAAEATQEEDLFPWYDVLQGRARKQYAEGRSAGIIPPDVPFSAFYNGALKAMGGADPLTVARSNTPWLTEDEKKQILRDYTVRKELGTIDYNYLLRPYSFFGDVLGLADVSEEKKKKVYDIDQLVRSLIAPTPGSSVSPTQRATWQHDIEMIRRSGLSAEEKKQAFLKLLIERYGYNPQALSSFGLGE